MKRKRVLTPAEQLRLIKEVQKHKVIWDASNKDHYTKAVLFVAWRSVAKRMNIPINECRLAWRAFKDKERYQRKRRDRLSSALLEPSETDSDIHILETPVDTKQKDLFEAPQIDLKNQITEKKDTFTTPPNGNENNYDAGEGSSCCSCTSENARNNIHDASTENSLEQSMKEFIDLKKNNIVRKEEFKNYAMLANLDNMLKDLPTDIVHELNVVFVNMTYAKLREFKNKN